MYSDPSRHLDRSRAERKSNAAKLAVLMLRFLQAQSLVSLTHCPPHRVRSDSELHATISIDSDVEALRHDGGWPGPRTEDSQALIAENCTGRSRSLIAEVEALSAKLAAPPSARLLDPQ